MKNVNDYLALAESSALSSVVKNMKPETRVALATLAQAYATMALAAATRYR